MVRPAKGMDAVYTIVPMLTIETALAQGGCGSHTERKRWATASAVFRACQEQGQPYLLLLADASCIVGVEWVAEVVDIIVDPAGVSTVHFNGLRPLPKVIRRHALLKRSDGTPLSEDFIRPYMPCSLAAPAARLVRSVMQRPAPDAGPQWRKAAMEQELQSDREFCEAAPTTRTALVDARLGQGGYRARMLAFWRGRCAVTGCDLAPVLIASHAKPWHCCSNAERLDEYNGLLLAAHVDRLFDSGLIGFDDEGRLLRQPEVSDAALAALGLSATARLKQVHARHRPYLRAHRQHFGLVPAAF